MSNLRCAGLLALLSLAPFSSAQRSSDARLLYLDGDCTTCITVDADAGEFTLLAAGDCDRARVRDKYWVLSDDSSWCLDDNPSLCVEEGGALILSERSSSRWQNWDFSSNDGGGDDGQIIGSSGDCVTLSGSTLRMRSCGTNNRNHQEWQQQTDREACISSSKNTNDGTLIFLDRDCNECLGVARSADDEALTIVECDDSSAIRHWTLEYLSSNIVERWCLADDQNLCIAEVGDSLRLRDDSADAFIFNSKFNDEIESVDKFNQCVTRMGSDVVMNTCQSSTDQLFTTDEQSYWDIVCLSGGGVIYNESQCGICIVASDAAIGSSLVEGDCDNVEDERNLFTFNRGYWCLESNENVCVETDSAGRLTLRGKSNEQRQQWVYDNNQNEIQTSVSSDICVARRSGSSAVDLESCNRVSGSASSWIMADYDRQYRDGCIRQQGNDPCKDGDLFVLDVDCNLCIGVGDGQQLIAVDCANSQDAVKIWDFTDNGLWRLMEDPNLCVGPDLRLQKCVEGQQSLRWTYSDISQIGNDGQRKIARWSSPDECITRRGLGSSHLVLSSCRDAPAAFNLDWDYATNTCDINCFDIMSAGDAEMSTTSGVCSIHLSSAFAISLSIIGIMLI